MPFAVTHVLFSIIAVDLYRDYVTKHKKYFTLHTVFIAGLAGLLPDIDIPLGILLNFFGIEFFHRTFTHTPLFGLIFLIPALIYWKLKKHKIAVYFIVICFGVLSHVLLDFLSQSDSSFGITLLYPFTFATFNLGLLGNLSFYQEVSLFAAIDAIILLLWLYHEEIKHKISDYI